MQAMTFRSAVPAGAIRHLSSVGRMRMSVHIMNIVIVCIRFLPIMIALISIIQRVRPAYDCPRCEHFLPPRGAAMSEGPQSIARAVALLRLMARRGPAGGRLTELSRDSGLPHPTVRRILKCLEAERLVMQDPETRRYQLGPLNFELGFAAMHRANFLAELRPKFERLALRTGDTVYIMLRSGTEVFCLDRVDGHTPVRALTMEIGGRRPMCFASSGQAMLARLPDEEVEHVLRANAVDVQNHARLTFESLREAVGKARNRGYGVIHDTLTFGVSAIGVAMPETPTRPMLGVALAMVATRLTPQRAKELGALLKREFLDVE
jgi:DNA-binding IclR family transcriptional regulator